MNYNFQEQRTEVLTFLSEVLGTEVDGTHFKFYNNNCPLKNMSVEETEEMPENEYLEMHYNNVLDLSLAESKSFKEKKDQFVYTFTVQYYDPSDFKTKTLMRLDTTDLSESKAEKLKAKLVEKQEYTKKAYQARELAA